MIDTKAPDQGQKLAEDGRYHLAECVDMGWWRLDWDVDCVHVGVPQGGPVAARAEVALFTVALAVLPAVTMACDLADGGAHHGR